MKACNAIVLMLIMAININAYSQNAWPINKVSNKVEFIDIKKWPLNIEKPEKRNLYLRQWYWRSLTQVAEKDVNNWLAKTDHEVTACGLPANAFYEYKTGKVVYKIYFSLKLVSSPKGINFKLYNFELAEIGEDYINTSKIEDVLSEVHSGRCSNCQNILTIFLKKINSSINDK